MWKWVAAGAAAVVLLNRKAQAASGACAPCYAAKSEAYRACTSIPPDQRTARDACFRMADQAFNTCIAACGG